MDSILTHLLFFAVGFFQDVLITLYYQSVSDGAPLRGAVLSTTVTLVNIIVLYKIITGIEDQVLSVIVSYALGNGIGTYYVIQRKGR